MHLAYNILASTRLHYFPFFHLTIAFMTLYYIYIFAHLIIFATKSYAAFCNKKFLLSKTDASFEELCKFKFCGIILPDTNDFCLKKQLLG